MRRSMSCPALAALLLAMASCVNAPPPPASAPKPVAAAPRPIPTPVPGADWRDWPLTPGDWVYRQDGRGSVALYGRPNADAVLTVRCDRLQHVVYLSRAGTSAPGVPITIRTSSVTRAVPAQPTGGTPAYMASTLQPTDGLLDAMGFSRGRFVVEQASLPTLVIPAWAEVERVTQDCRG